MIARALGACIAAALLSGCSGLGCRIGYAEANASPMIGVSYVGEYLVVDMPTGENAERCAGTLKAAVEKGALEDLKP